MAGALSAALLAACAGADAARDGTPSVPITPTSTSTSSPTTTTTTATPAPTATTLPAGPCTAVVGGLDRGHDLAADVDVLELATANALALPPIEGAEATVITDVGRIKDPAIEAGLSDSYTDEGHRLRELQASGFVASARVELGLGVDSFTVRVRQLGSPEMAAAFRDAHLLDTCVAIGGLRQIPETPSGVSFYLTDSDPAVARAVVAVGSYELNLTICTCVEVADRQALADRWAQAILTELTAA